MIKILSFFQHPNELMDLGIEHQRTLLTQKKRQPCLLMREEQNMSIVLPTGLT